MKKKTLILIILSSLNVLAQKRSKLFFGDFVECFYSKKETEPIYIYKKPDGSIVKKLNVLTQPHCWYKFTIAESQDDWLKIENIVVLPSCEEHELNKNIEKFKGKWVLAKKMKINLPDIRKESGIKIKFYDRPDKNSNVIFIALEYLSTELIKVKRGWAKVKFKINGELHSGWLQRKYQCPYPWTTCPVWN